MTRSGTTSRSSWAGPPWPGDDVDQLDAPLDAPDIWGLAEWLEDIGVENAAGGGYDCCWPAPA